jgi:hypothetical protein
MRHQVPPYRLPARIEQFFQEFVNKPFENHERSKAWVREVVNQDWRYHSQTLLEQGRTSFLQERNGLTPNPHRIRLRRELLLNRTWKRRL